MIRTVIRLAVCLTTVAAGASTITVDSLSDATGCSLRNAIIAANTNTAVAGCTAGGVGDIVNITVAGTYSPTSALPAITDDISITATLGNFVLNGAGAGATSPGLVLDAECVVRGLVIQNFGGSGIEAHRRVTIAGNRIGTDAAGQNAAPNCTGVGNAGAGVKIESTTGNVIAHVGGPNAADRNIIAGNQCHGLALLNNAPNYMSGSVEGNAIGANWCACDSIPNSGFGVVVNDSAVNHTQIEIGWQFGLGVTCSGGCNVIASNVLGQVHASGGRTNVYANVIGANAARSAALPTNAAAPTGDAILADGTADVDVDGCIIVRSTGAGIRVEGDARLSVQHSLIGALNSSQPAPNTNGIHVHNPTASGPFPSVQMTTNTIVSNSNAGILLDGANGATVRDNNIGFMNAASPVPLPNEGGGIVLTNGATNNIIGGNGQPNRIAFNTSPNGGAGIVVLSGAGNQFLQNAIYSNTGQLSSLPIDLGGDGATPNDPCDGDAGPNNFTNIPVITDATRMVTDSGCSGCFGTRITGTLNARPNTTYHIEVFTSPAGASPTEPMNYIGSTDVATDASCNAAWAFETASAGQATVVAIATSAIDGSSEVSAPHTVWAGQPGEPRYDSNADGFTDLLLRNYGTGSNASWLLNGSQQLFGIQNLAALQNTDYRIESTFYLALDGANRNILWRNYVTGANAIWTMPPGGSTPNAVINLPPIPNTQYTVGGTADFNGDGSTDILWRNNMTGAVAIWLMNGTSYASTVNLPSVAIPQWTIAGTGDFNADGRADIVWHNVSSGANAIWFMDGTGYVSTLDIQALPNTAYTIAAIGDYNRDRRPDIVWHNTTTGATRSG